MANFYRDKAIQGRVYSNYPAFYRNPDGTINQHRAAIALQAVDDVLHNGKRPATIAAEWRLEGITTARGGRVTAETVRRRSRGGRGLLSKKLRCGACGAGMVRMQQIRKNRPAWFAYNCRSVDSGGCGSVSISGPRADAQIIELVLAYLNQSAEVEDKSFDGQARLDELAGKIEGYQQQSCRARLSALLLMLASSLF